MKIDELKRIVKNHFEDETDQKRVISVIARGVLGLSTVEIGISGVSHWANQCRAKSELNAEFAAEYRECLKECLRSDILFPITAD